jgi:hypothetical protein
MEGAHFSETSITTYQSTRRHIQEYINLEATALFHEVYVYFQLRTAVLRLIVGSGLDVPTFATRHLQVSPRASTQRRKVELWARNVREFCLNADLHVTFRDLVHAVKLRHGTDRFTSPPNKVVVRIFFALKIRKIRPGANPRTWVPKASTLPLDHRSRISRC